jgi:hypothetical protein
MVKVACIALLLVLLFVPSPTTVSAQNPGKSVAAIPIVRHWQVFSDPNEGAFQIEVPQGWRVGGGTARRSALQFRLWATAISPDGYTILSVNDPQAIYYIAPSPMLSSGGFSMGSVYSPGGGNAYVVAPYQSGSQFAAYWGGGKLSSFCTSVTIVGSRERPDLSQRVNAITASLGIYYDFGETTFSCNRNGVPMTANFMVSTLIIGGSVGMWMPDTIESFVAPAPVAGLAAGILAHMVKSHQVNPTWAMGQSETTAAVSRITAQTNNYISDTIMSGWEQRGATIDRVMEEGSRTRLGIDIYSDPTTETEYTVGNTSNHYWTDAAGNVVGTDTDNAPGAGYRRLNRVPPR